MNDIPVEKLKERTIGHTKRDIVSDDQEGLILVDSNDDEIGVLDKESCHNGKGILHRALSVFVFNNSGELLVQQRHATKRLWGGYWSNSCCSHPRIGENTQAAAQRRLYEECGISVPLEFIFKFEYSAVFGRAGAEHELCSVFIGTTNSIPVINTTEVSSFQWQHPLMLDRLIEEKPNLYTPWFKTEWVKLRTEFSDRLPQIKKSPI